MGGIIWRSNPISNHPVAKCTCDPRALRGRWRRHTGPRVICPPMLRRAHLAERHHPAWVRCEARGGLRPRRPPRGAVRCGANSRKATHASTHLSHRGRSFDVPEQEVLFFVPLCLWVFGLKPFSVGLGAIPVSGCPEIGAWHLVCQGFHTCRRWTTPQRQAPGAATGAAVAEFGTRSERPAVRQRLDFGREQGHRATRITTIGAFLP